MNEDQPSTGIIDVITRFAMRQSSRRGFFKWVGKAGLALAAAASGSIAFFSQDASASYPCQKYLPGCHGACTCQSSGCSDPDDGFVDNCFGNCYTCPTTCVQLFVYYTWDGALNKCIQVQDCALCTCP